MIYGAIGGMRLKHWSGYFRIIIPTMKVLKAAKRADGCVKAETFKAGDVFFALSFWESEEQMQTFAKGGLHGRLTDVAMDQMALFYNHTHVFDEIPNRQVAVSVWKEAIVARNGNATVGVYAT